MFAKASAVFALFAVAAQVAVAAPPACLLAAVNTQSDPSDMAAVCGSGAQQVQKYMSSNCGDNLSTAMSAFADVCKDAGVTVSTSTTSASKTSSATSTASSSADKSPASSGTHTSAILASATLTYGGGAMPLGTGTAASSGFSTMTGANNGTYSAPTSVSASGTSGTSQPTRTGVSVSTGGAARLGMDLVGLAAVGVFGAMLAF